MQLVLIFIGLSAVGWTVFLVGFIQYVIQGYVCSSVIMPKINRCNQGIHAHEKCFLLCQALGYTLCNPQITYDSILKMHGSLLAPKVGNKTLLQIYKAQTTLEKLILYTAKWDRYFKHGVGISVAVCFLSIPRSTTLSYTSPTLSLLLPRCICTRTLTFTSLHTVFYFSHTEFTSPTLSLLLPHYICTRTLTFTSLHTVFYFSHTEFTSPTLHLYSYTDFYFSPH